MKYSEKQLYHISYSLRKNVLDMVYNAKTGHMAPSFSIAEIMATLYFNEMNIKPTEPKAESRDRFILSKGHACPIYYATLAKRGYFNESELKNYRKLNSILPGHPDMRKCPGVDMTTGSLGNGVAAALGMALAAKSKKADNYIFAIAGDGEIQEGIVWESALYAGNAKLDNLILFIDNNKLQSGGSVEKIQDLGSIQDKFNSYKWHTLTIDGHDVAQISNAVAKAKECKDMPSVIIANTVKGKGVSFMENEYLWHMKAPSEQEYKQACKQLEEAVKQYEQ